MWFTNSTSHHIVDMLFVFTHAVALILLTFSTVHIACRKPCNDKEQYLRYFKIKSCYRSNLPVISWANIQTVKECEKFAKKKNALAFNFSPQDAITHRKGSVRNCEVLGCPEIGNSTTFVPDLAFDYYSGYGNWTATQNATCIKSVGVFIATPDKLPYLPSIQACQDMGADIADTTTEIRTKYLSQYINDTIEGWYKVAYVGIDNYEIKDSFLIPSGIPLSCLQYRAWAPGHPRKVSKHKNCVVLDDSRMWRVARCSKKFQAICEFYPLDPGKRTAFEKLKCEGSKSEKKHCKAKKELWKQYRNASRVEKCEVFNDLFEENNLFN